MLLKKNDFGINLYVILLCTASFFSKSTVMVTVSAVYRIDIVRL